MNPKNILIGILAGLLFGTNAFAQITERPRPKEWDNLVPGARFIDRFLSMPQGQLSTDVWGSKNVLPRYVDNGIEDAGRSYWGGNILHEADSLYHLFVCGWPENSPKGHMFWPNSTVYHAVSYNSIGPFAIKDTIGKGHNPEIFHTRDGYYVLYVIDGYYKSTSVNGPWTYGKFDFDRRDRRIIEGLSNLTFARREDGSYLMVCRGGGIWISQTGLSPYNQITDKRVYPPVEGEFEDPVVWRDSVQYHLIVNDWLGRIAFYLRSKDGVNWVTDPGEAYAPGIAVHKNGHREEWFKYERPKVLQDEYGRAIQMNFAVIDTLKHEDLPNDHHSSKNISIPLNPGLLIEMLNDKPISKNTKTIRVKVKAEPCFDPQTDMDIASFRFGASQEVNFGRGSRIISIQKDGKDLILVFNAKNSGITAKEFAPKLIGRKNSGELLFGYTRLPGVEYNEAILSARKPVFHQTISGTILKITIENFGQSASPNAQLQLVCLQNGKEINVGRIPIPTLQPYARTQVLLNSSVVFEKENGYDFILRIISGKTESEYRFTEKF